MRQSSSLLMLLLEQKYSFCILSNKKKDEYYRYLSNVVIVEVVEYLSREGSVCGGFYIGF